MYLYVESFFYLIKYICVVASYFYLYACCGKSSIEYDGCKKKENDCIDKNNFNKCYISKKEILPVKTIEKQKSYRNINSKKLSNKKIFKNLNSNNTKFQAFSSFESKKISSEKENVKIQKQVRITNSRKKVNSMTKSKKTILKRPTILSSSSEILVPTREKSRLPNLPTKVIKNIEKFKPPNVVSYFKTQHITKESRLIHALDRIEIYLNRIKSY